MQEAYPHRLALAHEMAERLYALAFSEAEIAEFLTFFRSAAGAALVAKSDERRAIRIAIEQETGRVSVIRAREKFCAIHGCNENEVTSAASARVLLGGVWVQQPSYGEIERARPPLASALRLGGVVRLACIARVDGLLGDCEVLAESPTGIGFAAAAQSLKSVYRLSTIQMKQGAAGQSVAVLVRFPGMGDGGGGGRYEGAAPRSAAAMALAQDVLTAQTSGEAAQSAWLETMERQREARPPADISKIQWDEVMSALIAGGRAAMEDSRDLVAADLTLRLTDDQLNEALRFWRSPAGMSWKARNPAVLAKIKDATAKYRFLTWADAGRAFCKVRDCDTVIVSPPEADPIQLPSAKSAAPSTRKP